MQPAGRPTRPAGAHPPSAAVPARPAPGTNWRLLAAIVAAVLLVVAGFILIRSLQVPTGGPPNQQQSYLKQVTAIPAATLDQVAGGQAVGRFQAGGLPALTGPSGKPEVFYFGGEFCPYCAAQRWAVVIALSRFGTFSKLSTLTSSEASISTFTFAGSAYSSRYVDFVPLEEFGQGVSASGQRQVIQNPTADQQALLDKLDPGGSLPFLDVGNRYAHVGASYSAQLLLGLDWQQIIDSIKDPRTSLSQGVLGSANVITAAICQVTGGQPASVCQSTAVTAVGDPLAPSPSPSA